MTPGSEPSVLTATGTTTNTTLDFGLAQPLTLGNLVWYDVNNNGVVDAGEAGADGVTVQVYLDTNGSGAYEAGLDTLVATSVTVNGGYYTFTDLYPGGYFVVLPASNFTAGGALVNYQNSTPTSGGNSDVNNVDHGYVVGTLGGAGIVASSIVTLVSQTEPVTGTDGTDANGNQTLDFGFYQLTLGNQVWEDYNNNGVVNPGEPGLAGVTVTLRVNGNPVLTTTTDAGGYYTFTGLVSGTYQVGIVAPPGYVSSYPTELNPNLNGDGNDNGLTPTVPGGAIVSNPIDLTPGNEPVVVTATGTTVNPTVDFGVWQPSGFGDGAWYDLNGNGIQEPGEPPMAGITATLFISTPLGWSQESVSVTN